MTNFPTNYLDREDVSPTVDSDSSPLSYSTTVTSRRTQRFPDPDVHGTEDAVVDLSENAGEIEVQNDQDQPAQVRIYRSHFAALQPFDTPADPGYTSRAQLFKDVTLPAGESRTFETTGYRFVAVEVEFQATPSGSNDTTVIFREV
jgi:hypothetical protein